MSGPESRAVSPVVGVVLLVVIVVALAGVVATVVFDAAGPREPAPEVVLSMEPTDRPVAYELELENGDPLRGGKVEFRGTADETPLTGRLHAGETATVYPVAETVEIVWFGEYGTSHVLDEFDVDVGLPPVDETCNWVESQTGGHTASVTVNLVVHCDVETAGDVDVGDPGVVVGDVVSYDNAVDVDHGAVYGAVTADGPVDLDRANVVDDVSAGGDVTVTDESDVSGSIETGAAGSIDVDGRSTVAGSLWAGDDLSLDDATVGGDVEAPDVDIAGSTVEGDVVATAGISLSGATVEGDVYAPSGSFACSGSTIDGRDCASYTPEDPSAHEE